MEKQRRKPLKTVLVVGLAVVLLLALATGGYTAASLYIKNTGITLHPGRDIETIAVTGHLQNDPAWGSDAIGHSSYSMAGAGCLICCAAASATHLGIPVTPGQLNERLTAADGYDGALLLWDKLTEILPGIGYRSRRIFTANTLLDDLDAGLLPIVKVHYRHGGAQHWVLVVGAQDGDFMVLDPLQADGKPVPLAATHGKVYAYRILYPAG